MLPHAIGAALAMQASLQLPAIFGDHMVLQHGRTPIFGQAAPGAKVEVRIAGAAAEVVAGADGRWKAVINGLPAGAAAELTVASGGQNRTYRNVLLGDVWLCSGQSNMEWPLKSVDDASAMIPAATDEKIRLFTVAKRADATWTGDVDGKWVICSPKEAAEFSAVGYHFGLALRQSEGIPIGLIDSTWGGTPAEAWTPREAMAAHPDLAHFGADPMVEIERIRRENPQLLELQNRPAAPPFSDKGNSGAAEGWQNAAFDDSAWPAAAMPQQMQRVRGLEINGVVWFRRTIELTAAQAARPATLRLGAIDDYDITYVNGRTVGETPEGTDDAWTLARAYTVPAGTLKAGKNVIAVRVLDTGGAGGFMGSRNDMLLQIGSDRIPLVGDWRWKIEQSVPALPPNMPRPFNQNGPSTLYTAMIKPMAPYGLKGAIWYQGESNVGRDREYSALMPTLVKAWREAFESDLGFLFVQLANYQARKDQPGDSAWAALRESQLAVLDLPKTGFATAIDIGDATDIHPRNKRDVGRRLAASARTFAYPGSSGLKAQSPRVASVRWMGAEARIEWMDAASLKTSDGRAPVGFAVKGADGPWVWAEARIEGSVVIVRHPQGQALAGVQYGWADNPDVNVVNEHALPAIPFRRLKD